jgi:hypothetical protein
MEKDENNQPINFLDDEAEEGVTYIQPNIEIKLPAHKRMECRNIVQEIKKFGVNQRQLLYTIYLLTLELENVETMKAITKVVGENRDNVKISNLVISETE